MADMLTRLGAALEPNLGGNIVALDGKPLTVLSHSTPPRRFQSEALARPLACRTPPHITAVRVNENLIHQTAYVDPECARTTQLGWILNAHQSGFFPLSSSLSTFAKQKNITNELAADANWRLKKLLWRHFSRSLSMWFFSLLCWAHKRKIQLLSKLNQTPTLFFPHVRNESIGRTGSYEKSSSKILLLVAVAL